MTNVRKESAGVEPAHTLEECTKKLEETFVEKGLLADESAREAAAAIAGFLRKPFSVHDGYFLPEMEICYKDNEVFVGIHVYREDLRIIYADEVAVIETQTRNPVKRITTVGEDKNICLFILEDESSLRLERSSGKIDMEHFKRPIDIRSIKGLRPGDLL